MSLETRFANGVFGIPFIGNTITAVLFGVTSVQVFLYFKQAREDGSVLKALVFVLWMLDALEQTCFTVMVYQCQSFQTSCATRTWKTPSILLLCTTIIAGLSNLIVRGIFSYRLWKFTGNGRKSSALTTAIAVLAVAEFVGSIVVALFNDSPDRVDSSLYNLVLRTTFSCGAVADIIVAAFLSMAFLQHRSCLERKISLIRNVMLYTINTGALTSLFAIASLIISMLLPGKYVFLTLLLMLSKLLLNTVLSLLNARPAIREAYLNSDNHISIHVSNLFTSGDIQAVGETELGKDDELRRLQQLLPFPSRRPVSNISIVDV